MGYEINFLNKGWGWRKSYRLKETRKTSIKQNIWALYDPD